MAITFDCPHCGKSLTTGDDKAGLTAKCPGCGQPIRVPEPAAEAAHDHAGEAESVEDDAPAKPDIERPRTHSCPMCGAENAALARRCHACGEPFPESRLRTGEPKPLELGATMSLAWDIFKDHMPVTVGAVFFLHLLAVVWFATGFIGVATLIAGADQNDEVLYVISALAGSFSVASWLLMAFIGPGYVRVLLEAVRGEEYTFGTLFSCGRYFLANLLATMMFIVAIGFGFAACAIPGMILALMWWAYQFVIIDEDASAISSLSRSKELMAGRWADVFLIAFIGSLLNAAIASACYVAGVFSQAYLGVLMAVVYVKLRGEDTAKERRRFRRSQDADVDVEADERED